MTWLSEAESQAWMPKRQRYCALAEHGPLPRSPRALSENFQEGLASGKGASHISWALLVHQEQAHLCSRAMAAVPGCDAAFHQPRQEQAFALSSASDWPGHGSTAEPCFMRASASILKGKDFGHNGGTFFLRNLGTCNAITTCS